MEIVSHLAPKYDSMTAHTNPAVSRTRLPSYAGTMPLFSRLETGNQKKKPQYSASPSTNYFLNVRLPSLIDILPFQNP